MPKLITVNKVAEEWGVTLDELISYLIENDDVFTACCEEGCMVEPDGYCPHGHPSVLVKLGMI